MIKNSRNSISDISHQPFWFRVFRVGGMGIEHMGPADGRFLRLSSFGIDRLPPVVEGGIWSAGTSPDGSPVVPRPHVETERQEIPALAGVRGHLSALRARIQAGLAKFRAPVLSGTCFSDT